MACSTKLAKWRPASLHELPSDETANCSFSDCIILLRLAEASGSLVEAKRAHNSLKHHLLHSTFLSNSVIRTYANCGAPIDARMLFNEMLDHNIISWNFMLKAYVKTGYRCDALQLFEQMHQECTLPDSIVYGLILASFISNAHIKAGRLIHARISCDKYASEKVLLSGLISMYAKCGSIISARCLFDEVQEQDSSSWSALIAGYSVQGFRKEAMQLLRQMRNHGLLLNSTTIVSVVGCCSSPSALDDAKYIHNQVKGMGLEADVVVNNALISMYVKCGSLVDANKVFDDMLVRNKTTFLSILSTCASDISLVRAKRLQGLIHENRLDGDIIVQNALMTMFGKCGSMRDAERVFDKMTDRDLVSWNALLSGYSQNLEGECACQLFDQILQEGVLPNKITFVSSIDACATLEHEAQGQRLHALVSNSVLETEAILGTSLIHMYGKCRNCEVAQEMFDRIVERDLPCWNSLVTVYSQCGQFETAFSFFHQMQEEGVLPDKITFVSLFSGCYIDASLVHGMQLHARISCGRLASDIVIGNALVNMYGKCSDLKAATNIFLGMKERDSITFINIFSIYASCAALSEGHQVHANFMGTALETDLKVGNVLINMYGKCGSLRHARKFFDRMLERNVVSWNAMLAVYAQNGLGYDALDLFQLMKNDTEKPNAVTLVCILTACSHAGLVDEGHSCFCSMVQRHGLQQNSDHYNCMIDMLTRAGRLDEAEELIKNIPCGNSVVTWITLLGACRDQNDASRAVRIAQRVFQLYPSKSSAYVTLSNIFTLADGEDVAPSISCKTGELDESAFSTFHVSEESIGAH